MTTNQQNLDLLIENMSIQEFFGKEQEYEKITISFISTIDIDDEDEGDDYENKLIYYHYCISKDKKEYKVVVEVEHTYGAEDYTNSYTIIQKEELLFDCCFSMSDTFDRKVIIGDEYFDCDDLKEFVYIFTKSVDLIGKLYKPLIPIEVDNELKYSKIPVGLGYMIQKNKNYFFKGKNMYSIHSRNYKTRPILTYLPSQVCIFKEEYVVKYISCLNFLRINEWDK